MAQLVVHTTAIIDIVIAKDTGLIFSYSQDSVGFLEQYNNIIECKDFPVAPVDMKWWKILFDNFTW